MRGKERWFSPTVVHTVEAKLINRNWWVVKRDNPTRLCPKFHIIVEDNTRKGMIFVVYLSWFPHFSGSSIHIVCLIIWMRKLEIINIFIEYLSYSDTIEIAISYNNENTWRWFVWNDRAGQSHKVLSSESTFFLHFINRSNYHYVTYYFYCWISFCL